MLCGSWSGSKMEKFGSGIRDKHSGIRKTARTTARKPIGLTPFWMMVCPRVCAGGGGERGNGCSGQESHRCRGGRSQVGQNLSQHHRVPGFLYSRPNWVPHPSLAASVAPAPPLDPRGEHTRLRGRGCGDPIPTKGLTLWNSMYPIIIPLRSVP
jgi:hypothetical protein